MKFVTRNPDGTTSIGTRLPDRDQRDWVTTEELITEAGITYRQADYWCRTGLINPIDEPTPGSGWTRRYSTDQLARARAINTLLEGGVVLQTVRQVVDEFVATGTATYGPVTFTLSTGDPAA